MDNLNEKMKKCFSCLSKSQSQPCQQHEPLLDMSNFSSFSPSDVREAWDFVQTRTTGADKMAVFNTYTEAVKKVEQQARKIFKDEAHSSVPSSDFFVQRMIEQGCFILQVALLSLGGPPEKLTEDGKKDRFEYYVPSLFEIRSQVPLVILTELMKQTFFQEVLKSKSREQWRRPKDTARMVLFDQLVEPMLAGSDHKVNFIKHFFHGFVNKSMGFSDQESPTLLHALWLQQTGPGAIISKVDNGKGVEDDESNSSWYTIRSARELQTVGITFKSNQGKGSRGIEFKEKMIDAVLYFPTITVESNTKILFQYLIDYEGEIGLGKTQSEVCSYLKLMGELVRTTDDAKVLAMQGIVNADPKGEEDLPEILKELQLPEVVGDNRHMIEVRCKIRSYVKPSKWGKVMDLIVITVILTFIQTFYAMLSYHYPKK